MRVAVIGGGPAGLVTLKYLITTHEYHAVEPIETRLFEAKDSIAGTFRYRVYEDAELVSSKYLTAFSDFRFSPTDADFVSTRRFCQYLEDYATNFKLWPHISLDTDVTSVRRTLSGGHVITFTKDGKSEEWECDAVAVCSGLHVNPDIPEIPGIENVPKVMHSSQFKTRADFGEGTNVMVLGAGETAMDVSHLAVTSPTKSVTMCHRDGWFYAPKILPVPVLFSYFNKSEAAQRNIPADTTVASLFDTAYCHPILQKSPLLWDNYDQWAKNIFWLISGTRAGLDQWAGKISNERFHFSRIFLCKSGKALPYISAPYRKYSLLSRIRAFFINVPIPDTRGRTIDLAPWPASISKEGIVSFVASDRPEALTISKRTIKPDVLVFCTGYLQSFLFLDSSYATPIQCDMRGVFKSDDPTVGFIGFKRPFFGAIPPLAELQTQLWILNLLGKMPPKPQNASLNQAVDLDYKLHVKEGRRDYENYGVDHEAYAYQLALDQGAAASISQVLPFGFKTMFVWAMGPNFNTKHRLTGPWKWDGANDTMQNELWSVVKQTGGGYYFMTYTVIPFIVFGIMSTALYAVCGVVDLFRWGWNSIRKNFQKEAKVKRVD